MFGEEHKKSSLGDPKSQKGGGGILSLQQKQTIKSRMSIMDGLNLKAGSLKIKNEAIEEESDFGSTVVKLKEQYNDY